jgi:Type II secretion system (T2SS), protein G
MNSTDGTSNQVSLSRGYFVFGGLSFIPLLGVVFGLISIIIGLFTKRRGGKTLAAVGGGGILFSAVLYGALFYYGFYQRGGVYDELRVKLAQTQIDSLVAQIELYRVQNGKYPQTLKELQDSLPKGSLAAAAIIDPTQVHATKSVLFFYEPVGDDHYYLRGVGGDGIAFTDDDILPRVTMAGTIGLLKDSNRKAR